VRSRSSVLMRMADSSDSSVDLRIRDFGSHRIVYLQGELAMSTAPAIEYSLASTLLLRDLSLVLDMGGVDFIDSSGFGALISWHHRVEDGGGRIRLMRVPDCLRTLLRLAQMEGRFKLIESEAELSATDP
ncbi:MAG: STAS domain-containing protein, partial [Leptospirales bacterium]